MSNHFEAEKEEGATLRKNRCPDMLASFESSGMSFRLHGVKEPPKSPRESQINYISIGIKRKPKDGELARLK